jgi:hypothetical protein
MNNNKKIKNRVFNIGIIIIQVFIIISLMTQCNNPENKMPKEGAYKIIFLHHSTGNSIWKGSPQGFDKISNIFNKVNAVPKWFESYNTQNGTNYFIKEQSFPKGELYPWDNYPYDYYNIWVKNAGPKAYMEEPTLEMLATEYNMIIFKHCFPVGYIEEDTGVPDLESNEKRLENYKLQYAALKDKLLSFPDIKFLVWTGAANVESKTTPEYAQRTKTFFDWVKTEWDTEGDNIFLWDFFELETEGGIYLTNENARNDQNSHPGIEFSAKASTLFCQRITDIIETNGQKTSLTGEKK